MWTWYSSNPRANSGRLRVRWGATAAAALLAVAPGAAQPLRQVRVEFRIDPGSTLDQPRLTAPAVVDAIESELARLAHEKFLYLDWVPAAGDADPLVPRWAVRLADGPKGACNPPSVRARFRAGWGAVAAADFPSSDRGDIEAWSYPEQEFSTPCDLALSEMTTAQLADKVTALAELVLGDADAMQALEERFLSEIVVAKKIFRDSGGAQKLFLPVRGLMAKTESEIEVRFENGRANRLLGHPGDIEGTNTQLLIESFVCSGIVSDTPPVDALPRPWHPLLQEVLDTCRDPWIYMKVYKPDPKEGQVERGIVTTLDNGGMP